jgi:type IV pilus assembly protein PilV
MMNTPRNPSTTLEFPSAGFSLIEVLVTTWLIGVGMLGMAALQSRAIANGDDHLQRSTAAMLVNDLLEQIRATPAEWSTYLQAAPPPVATASPCPRPPSQPAAQLACWYAELALLLPGSQALPSGASYVCRSPSPGVCASNGSGIEIHVAWHARQGECSRGNAPCHVRVRSEI